MNHHFILKTAMKAARILLQSGSEAYRVEDTVNRIMASFGITAPQTYVTPTGIIMSGEDEKGQPMSLVQRINGIDVDLEKISMVNDLSRRITLHEMSIQEFDLALDQILRRPHYPLWLVLVGTSLISASFTIMFGGNLTEAALALLAGPIVYLFKRLTEILRLNPFLQNSVGGFIAVVIGGIGRMLGISDSFTFMVIGTIMLLVPGIAITNAIRDTFMGDYLSGTGRIVNSIVTAGGIAFGTGLGFVLMGVGQS